MNRYFAVAMLFLATVVLSAGMRTDASTPVVPGYTVVDLGAFGGLTSWAYGVNDDGVVVGFADTAEGFRRAFRFAGTLPLEDLGVLPGGTTSGASGINAAGIVVGTSSGPTIGSKLAVWDAGPAFTPPPFSSINAFGAAINDAGVIVGDFAPPPTSFRRRAFWYQPGEPGFTDVGALLISAFNLPQSYALDVNESGVAVGWAVFDFVTPPVRAFRFVPPSQIELLPSLYSSTYDHYARAINDQGDIVGTCLNPPAIHACMWSAGQVIDLHTPAGGHSNAYDINNKGEIVGELQRADGTQRAFLRTGGGQMIELGELISPDPSWELRTALSINEHSQIVGMGLHNQRFRAFLLTPAAMPGSDVVVTPRDPSTGTTPVTLTFDEVTKGGATTVTSSESGPTPPDNFQAGSPAVYYDITTTATFTGSVTVCLNYAGITFSGTPALFHYENGAWVDITQSLDAANQVVCGVASSLSPFAIFSSAHVNLPPTAFAGGPYQVGEGGSLRLTGSGSDPEGSTLLYAWDLNNDGTFETTGANATFSAAIDGPASVTVAMQVTDDGQLSDVDTAIITILNVPPAVGAITLASGPFLIGESVAPSVTFADPGTADKHTAVWSWGDGTPDTVQVVELGTRSASADHVYAAPGSYAVGVTVTDDDAGTSSTQVTRTVIYKLCLRYDPDRPVRAGAMIPIRLQICSAAGENLSSLEVPLHVVTNPITNADFRFDPTLADTGGYVLNVMTQGLTPGVYQVPFTAGTEAYRYVVSFRIR